MYSIFNRLIQAVGGMMNDRRGHRKLRLTSRKHFKPKPKGPLKEQQQHLLDFKLSLPLAAYTEAPVKSLDILHGRLKKCAIVPVGM